MLRYKKAAGIVLYDWYELLLLREDEDEGLPGNESCSAVAMLVYGMVWYGMVWYGIVGRVCFRGDCPATEYMSMNTSDSIFL
jgi:hypothetical protein